MDKAARLYEEQSIQFYLDLAEKTGSDSPRSTLAGAAGFSAGTVEREPAPPALERAESM